jgi:hypothetical protein
MIYYNCKPLKIFQMYEGTCFGHVISKVTHPQLLEGLKEKSQVEDNEKERESGYAP